MKRYLKILLAIFINLYIISFASYASNLGNELPLELDGFNQGNVIFYPFNSAGIATIYTLSTENQVTTHTFMQQNGALTKQVNSVIKNLSPLFIAVQGEKVGCLSVNNQWIIPPVYDSIICNSPFWCVQQDGKWGVYDSMGNIICNTVYNDFSVKDGCLILTASDGSADILDSSGTIIFKKNKYYILGIDTQYGIALCNNKNVYSNESAKLLSISGDQIPILYDNAKSVGQGMCIVANEVDGSYQYGAIDYTGKLCVPLIYNNLTKFNSEGLSLGQTNQGLVILNQSGIVVTNLSPHITDVMIFSTEEGLAQYKSIDKYGYLDSTTWKEIIPAQFNTTTSFSNGLAKVSLDSGYGIINTAGQFVVEPIYDSLIGWDAPDANYCWGFKDENVYVCNLKRNDMISPSTCRISIGENDFQIGSYLLIDSFGGGTNYVKLRDLASILNNTNAKFNVEWSNSNGITITQGQPYNEVGGELIPKGTGLKAFSYNDGHLSIDGKEVALQGITILGNNYFKIRDLAKILDLEIDYIAETDTVAFPSCQ